MANKTSFMSTNLAQRLLSALVLIPPIVALVWAGGWLYFAACVLFLFLTLKEWLGLTAPGLSVRGKVWAFGLLPVILFAFVLKGAVAALVLSLLATPLLWFYASRQNQSLIKAWPLRPVWAVVGLPLCVASTLALIHLRSNEEQGLVFIVYLFAIVWGTDTGAYASGRLIGGPKIWPQISPNKTWAGLFGGMALAGLLGYAVAQGFEMDMEPLWAAVLAVVFAVVAQMGDFFESHLKRRAGVKDSGQLIPGHGGLLDRVDGLLPVAMGLALIV